MSIPFVSQSQITPKSKKDLNNVTVSFDKRITSILPHHKKGAGKLGNRFFNFFLTALERGETDFSFKIDVIAKQLDVCERTVYRYLKELREIGLITYKKIRKKCGQFKVFLQKKFIEIKGYNFDKLSQKFDNLSKMEPVEAHEISHSQPTEVECIKNVFLKDLEEGAVDNFSKSEEEDKKNPPREKEEIQDEPPVTYPYSHNSSSNTLDNDLFPLERVLRGYNELIKPELVGNPLPISISKLKYQIYYVLPNYFQTLDELFDYFKELASNPLLMGKKQMNTGKFFDFYLSWALKPTTIEKYKNQTSFFQAPPFQKYNQTPSTRIVTPVVPSTRIEEEIPDEKTTAVVARLSQRMRPEDYSRLIEGKKFKALGIQYGQPHYKLDNVAYRDQINGQYSQLFAEVFAEVFG